jgi:hypothetical protein
MGSGTHHKPPADFELVTDLLTDQDNIDLPAVCLTGLDDLLVKMGKT